MRKLVTVLLMSLALPAVAATTSTVKLKTVNTQAPSAPAEAKTKTTYTFKPAQQDVNAVFSPVLGFTYTDITGGNESSSRDTGFNAGFTVDFGSDQTVFHTGLLYSQLNTKIDGMAAPGRPLEITFVQNFLSIPIQGKTYFAPTKEYEPYVRYGVLANILLNANMKAEGQSVDVKDKFNNVDFMASLGIGARIPMERNDLLLDFSFNRSLRNTNQFDGAESTYNRSFMVNVGVTL